MRAAAAASGSPARRASCGLRLPRLVLAVTRLLCCAGNDSFLPSLRERDCAMKPSREPRPMIVSPCSLAVHGGAGTLRRGAMSATRAEQYHAGLRRALAAGRDILAADG